MSFQQTADSLYRDWLDGKISWQEFSERKTRAWHEMVGDIPSVPLSDLQLADIGEREAL
jgi:hypothetical protein